MPDDARGGLVSVVDCEAIKTKQEEKESVFT